MKVKQVIIPGFFILLLGCTSAVYSACGCQQVIRTTDACGCTKTTTRPYYPSCQCTDPACRGYNNCLDCAQCCRVFGNIGDSRDGTLVDP